MPTRKAPSPPAIQDVMRWAQLTLVEDDPGKFDPDFWLDYFRRMHADGACLSAGGCVAFYPTDVPLHYRSKWLGEADPFGYLVEGCRKMNMAVLARVDPHACHDDVHGAHPDWIAVTADGQPCRHWSHPDYWVTCALGPYNFEFMLDVVREIAKRYNVEGIFANRWSGSGACYCEHCAASFRAESGLDLPRGGDIREAPWRAYDAWRQKRLFEQWRLWDDVIRRANPKTVFIPNVGGGATSDLDMATVGRMLPLGVADRQARSGLTAPWANGKSAKEFRAALGPGKPVIGIFNVGPEEQWRWKDAVTTDAEIRLWVADGVAHGMRPWLSKFSGVVHDPRWIEPVARIYDRLWKWEKYLRNTANLARVAVVYSQQTARFYGGADAGRKVQGPIAGWHQALVEARIPFEMVHDGLLDAALAERFGLLILPNVAALSDAQCEALRGFVARGGSVVATFETSLYDALGQRRADFGLGDLFGVRWLGTLEGPMKNAYLRLNHGGGDGRRGGDHPVLAGLEDAPRIIHGLHRLAVEPRANVPDRPLTLIPTYPDLPMEEVYPRGERADTPELFLRQVPGGGRVAFCNWDVDRAFWEVLAADHGRLMANTARWALGEAPRVEVRGAGVMDVAAWRQEKSLTVHLVNLTNPMMMKGPCRELIASPPQEVRVHLAALGIAPESVRAVRLLAADTSAPRAVSDDGWLIVQVPSVLDHEVVAVDLS